MSVKILLLGGFGLLGSDIYSTFSKQGINILRYPKAELNMLNQEQLFRVIALEKPDVVINAAGYTNVNESEVVTRLAFEQNCTAVLNLCEALRDTKIRLIHISTDYVFDGNKRSPYQEEDPRKPINFYGLSKKISEDLVKGLVERHYLIRTSWLFGHNGQCFPNLVINTLRRGGTMKIVNDQIGSPTYTIDLSQSLALLVRNSDIPFGTYHVTNQGQTDWYSLANRIARESGLPTERIIPIVSDEYNSLAQRPRYSVLDGTKWDEVTQQPMDSYYNALNRYIKSTLIN